MRFVMFMYPGKPPEEWDAWHPTVEEAAAMGAYNDELLRAGVLLAGEGLHPPTAAARVTWDDESRPSVVDGPFAEAKEVVGGYWLIETRSREEAVEWARRIPGDPNAMVELRQVIDTATEWPPEVAEAAWPSGPPPR